MSFAFPAIYTIFHQYPQKCKQRVPLQFPFQISTQIALAMIQSLINIKERLLST
jgi:hypothetical protein